MSDVKISVIMPVYKVEKYVGKAIESVLNQTLEEIELLAVDDGSPDNSGAICENYASKDKRMIVIHQENQGAPTARNKALDIASGKYVYFIDSDDWIEPDMLEKMYDAAETNDAEIVVVGFCMEYYEKGRDVTYYTKCPDRIYSSIEEFRSEAHKYFNNSILSLPWNKLFRLDYINGHHIRFRDTKWDDHHFCMDCLMDCQSIVLRDIEKYHWYRSRKGSETMINYSDAKMFEKRKEHFEHILQLYDHWNIHSAESNDSICCYYLERLCQCTQELVDNKNISKQERDDRIKQIFNDPLTGDAIKYAKGMSVKMKIMCYPLRHKQLLPCIIMGKVINCVRKFAPGLFISLKEKEKYTIVSSK